MIDLMIFLLVWIAVELVEIAGVIFGEEISAADAAVDLLKRIQQAESAGCDMAEVRRTMAKFFEKETAC